MDHAAMGAVRGSTSEASASQKKVLCMLPSMGLLYVTYPESMAKLGIEASPGSADQFGAEIKRDLARYGQVVKAAGIQVE